MVEMRIDSMIWETMHKKYIEMKILKLKNIWNWKIYENEKLQE